MPKKPEKPGKKKTAKITKPKGKVAGPKRKRRTSASKRVESFKERVQAPMTEAERKKAFARLDTKKLPDFVKSGLKKRFTRRDVSIIEFNSWIRIFDQLLTKLGTPRSLEEFMKLEKKSKRPTMTTEERAEEERKLAENTYLPEGDKKEIIKYWDAHPELTWVQAHKVNHYFVGRKWYNQMLERRKIP